MGVIRGRLWLLMRLRECISFCEGMMKGVKGLMGNRTGDRTFAAFKQAAIASGGD